MMFLTRHATLLVALLLLAQLLGTATASPGPALASTGSLAGRELGSPPVAVSADDEEHSKASPPASAADVAEQLAPDGRPMVAGYLIVTFRSGVDEAERAAAHAAAGALATEDLALAETVHVRVDPATTASALASYRGRPSVRRAEPDLVVGVDFTPNDPLLPQQWNLFKIAAPAAWDRSRSAPRIRIAILDTGIFSGSSEIEGPDRRPGHPDLRPKIVLERNFSTAANVDDFFNHGTLVAGIAAAATNNALGVAGVGFDASLINAKVLNDTGRGAISRVVNGIRWATDNGARVVNMSFGGSGTCPATLQAALDYAWARNVVLVASAGNSGVEGADFPGNCRNVIAVAATDQDDRRASFSNVGRDVDIAAPGVEILSTNLIGAYSRRSGTSFSAPHVSGVAALVWTTKYGTSNRAVVNRVLNTADPISGTGRLWTHGRVNAAAAVAGADLLPAPPPPGGAQPAATVKDDEEDRPRATAERRQQRERTNQLGLDDYHTEGNVVEVQPDAEPPVVVIGTRDGLQQIRLLCHPDCALPRVGEYVDARGVKQHEGLFEAEELSSESVR